MLEIDSSSCIHDRKNSFRFFKVKSSLRYSRAKLLLVLQLSVTFYNGRGAVYNSQRGDAYASA